MGGEVPQRPGGLRSFSRSHSVAEEPSVFPILTVIRLACLSLLTISISRTAWLSDDALITLRHVLNATHGWGPGFNVSESVLGSTHPLWMLLWMGAGFLTDSWILSNFVLSISLSAFAAALIVWSARSVLLVVGASLALLLSSAFIDYSTSGLENPLSLALVGLLILQSRPQQILTPLLGAVLGLSAAAVILTRADLLLLVLPPLLHLLIRWRRRVKLVLVGLAFFVGPIAAWGLWSWVNFSSLVPNTFAAKSNLDIPRGELLLQGVRYLQVSLEYDWGTALVLVAGGAVVAVIGSHWSRIWLLGVVIYLLYVVWVGGDFMIGRFLAVPVYVVVFLVILLLGTPRFSIGDSNQAKVIWSVSALIVVGIVFVTAPTPTSLTRDPSQRSPWSYGIVDERGFYAEGGRSLHAFLGERRDTPAFQFRSPVLGSVILGGGLGQYESAAKSWPERLDVQPGVPTAVGVRCGLLGSAAIVSGPTVHWVDSCALTDRFLANIPYSEKPWRIGHFSRAIPEGYVEAIRTNDAGRVKDPDLRRDLSRLWSRIR